MIRYVPVTLEVPEDMAADVREFFERSRTGSLEFHTVDGKIKAVVVQSHKRVREPTKVR